MINYTNKYNFAILKYNRKYLSSILFWKPSIFLKENCFDILIFKILLIYLYIESQNSEIKFIVCFVLYIMLNLPTRKHSYVVPLINEYIFWFTVEWKMNKSSEHIQYPSKAQNWSQRQHNGIISWGFNAPWVWTQNKKIHDTQAITLCIPLLIVSNKLLLLLIDHNALLLSPEIPPYNTSQRHQLPKPTWVGIKLFAILGFAIDLPEFVGLIATVRVQVSHDEGWWAPTIIQIHNTSSRILSLILHLKKISNFLMH